MKKNMIIFLLMSFVFVPNLVFCETQREETSTSSYKNDYEFTKDWFSQHIPIWEETFASYRGKPNVNYLEIGVYEGRSFLWMLDHIFTDPSASLTGVDLFSKRIEKLFLSNLALSGQENKATILKGDSGKILKTLPENSFDIIYVDGGHSAKQCIIDMVLSWPLLKEDGILVIDDYDYHNDEWPISRRPKYAVDFFITAYEDELEILHQGYQSIFKKKADDCPVDRESEIGKYCFRWNKDILMDAKSREEIMLSETETDLIKKILNAKEFGEITPTLDDDVKNSLDFKNLVEKLDLFDVAQ